jgi:phosphonate transport system ATP-binding protein
MIRLEHVTHRYANGTQALNDISLGLNGASFTVLIGPSGAGKSTLMRVLNALVKPTQGRVWLGSVEVTRAPGAAVRRERRKIGMVFQQFNLIKRVTALENVLLGRLGYNPVWRTTLHAYTKTDKELAMRLLDRVGMADQAWQRADTLSGGQQQRVGIARALAQEPELILADEPISALDPKSSEQIMDLLRTIQREDGISVIANLHHLDAVREYAERVIALRAGEVVFDGRPEQLTPDIARGLYYGEEEQAERTHDAGISSTTGSPSNPAIPVPYPISPEPTTARFDLAAHSGALLSQPIGMTAQQSKKEWEQ